MRKLVLKALLLISPFAVIVVLELFVLPIDFFTFRAYEALQVYKFIDLLPGPFYPNYTLEKVEEGDLASHTAFARKKEVVWKTDRYGYRFDPQENPDKPFDVIIVGDSYTVGPGITQHDLLNEVLRRELGLSVYPYAPRDLNDFLKDRHFNPSPKIVILARLESYCWKGLSETSPQATLPRNPAFLHRISPNKLILLDRFYRANSLNYTQQRIQRILTRALGRWVLGRKENQHWSAQMAVDHSMLFNKSDLIFEKKPPSQETILAFANDLKHYQNDLKQNGIHLIFMPIPLKSTVYFDRVPEPPTDFLVRLISACRNAGIDTIDLATPFREEAHGRSPLLYQEDDTHWNRNGVLLAAELLKERIHLKN